ncbi:PD-(D/E)XK nuclease family protein [Flagellimonas sp.]|uniref:PD-(D/E)XK nuclease family protein n=1 Tax=Flagellimonas sp. TaxID=2058762 RepID=UPI003F4A591E
MQQPFIEYVLQDLVREGSSIENNLYILPSKRSGVFLKHYLSNILKKTVFTPRIISIEEFVQEISGVKKASNIDLLLTLYESYQSSPAKEKDDFDTFLKWGETLLQDFNEIDRYLLPANDILNYLKSIKELDHWSLQPQKTPLVQNYLDFWEHIEYIYHDFNSRLIAKNLAHQGLIYRLATNNITEYAYENLKNPIVFLGFNALNTAESQIIQHLLSNTQCEVYWDIDACFLNDPVHDAGLFIRKYLNEWPHYKENRPKGIHGHFLTPKNIEITGVPKSISQTKYVGNTLKKQLNTNPEKTDNVAIILADESLLFPVAKSIPPEINKINITMGQSLRTTLLYSFFISVFELFEGKTKKGWYYKEVLNFVGNPYFKMSANTKNPDFVNHLTGLIKANSTTYIDAQSLRSLFVQKDVDFKLFPSHAFTPNTIIEYCLSLLLRLQQIFRKENNAVELQYAFTFYNLFHQLKKQLASIGFVNNIKTVKRFFKQLATMEVIDYIGSPIEGLQLMGVLESRTLDFETVIITSVNEGILPAGKSNSSFIPFDVKREYGLPTYKEKDAIYTYHFYRLIQRAKNVHIIYNTEPDVLEGGEKSRLISQLLTDNNIKPFVTHNIASPNIRIKPLIKEQIKKTPLLISDLKDLAEKGLSPSSLSSYIKNPMEFYKKYVLRLQDSIEVQEDIAANTFGTILHEALFLLYQPYLGKILIQDNFSSMRGKVNSILRESFHKHLPNTDLSKGRYLLIFHVIERYIENFVLMESKQIKHHQIKLLHLEKKFETTLDFDELHIPIKFKGFIDRIDEFDGTIRVIDYKTGKTEPSQVKIKSWEELDTSFSKSKAFQLLCYAYLLNRTDTMTSCIAGIYALKNLKNGFMPFSFNRNSILDEGMMHAFQNSLKKLILEIYNPEIPFEDKE